MLLVFLAAMTAQAEIARPAPVVLEAVGRLKNLDTYEPIDHSDDILGHGWVTARLTITRVVSGRAPGRVIDVRYLTHSMRNWGRRPVRVRLAFDAAGHYTLCAVGGTGLVCA